MAGLDPTSLSPIGIGASVLQTGLGVYQAISGSAKMKKLQAQRKSYEVPEEIQKILNASLSNAQGDTITQNYQTNLIQQQSAAAIGAAERGGADPNVYSAIFGQGINAIRAVGNDTHAKRMEYFGKIIQAYNLVADNEAARQKSVQDILKDKIQSSASNMQSGLQNIAGGVNTAIAVDSAARQAQLYKEANAKAVAAGLPPIYANEGAGSTTSVSSPLIGGIQQRTTQNPYVNPLAKPEDATTIYGTRLRG